VRPSQVSLVFLLQIRMLTLEEILFAVLPQFESAVAAVLSGVALSKINRTTEEDCGRYCIDMTDMLCLGFSFASGNGSCLLFAHTVSASTPLVFTPMWIYRARLLFESSALLTGGAFIEFGYTSLLSRINDIQIEVLTSADAGVVWRQGQMLNVASPLDFMGVQVSGGRVLVAFDFGSGM
jgi:hypothetical protein